MLRLSYALTVQPLCYSVGKGNITASRMKTDQFKMAESKAHKQAK